ncbi:MAG: hypothetical protein IJ659_06115 [Alloprevotella sp.]|nr:hypothetical protein [Alloprevotella sp.]
MKYKPQYSADEVGELLQWVDENLDKLPQSLNLGREISIPDLRRTVEAYREMAQLHGEERPFSGQVYTLMRIREAVEAGPSAGGPDEKA